MHIVGGSAVGLAFGSGRISVDDMFFRDILEFLIEQVS
jgi:hypothetical protein